MPIFTYTGNIVANIYSNNTVGGRHRKDTGFVADPINWSGTVPNVLVGKSWQDLQDLPEHIIFNWHYRAKFRITGEQYYDDSSTPLTYVHFSQYTNDFDASSSGSLGTGKYDVDHTVNVDSPESSVYLRVYNSCARGLPGCVCYDAKDYSFTLTLEFTLEVDCHDQYLGFPICLMACDKCDKESCVCKDSYIDYCLPIQSSQITLLDPTGPIELVNPPPIADSTVCQNFISNLIVNTGPDARVDQGLNNYCQAKYQGFGDLFNNNQNQVDVQLCACHMPNEQYQNFEAQIDKDYPGLGNLGIEDRCLVPQCASSVYKSIQTGPVCNVPKCLVINSFNNNGTFDNSTVNVNTDARGCADITGGNIPPSNNDRSRAIIIGAVAVLILLIILIIIISVAASGNNSKKK